MSFSHPPDDGQTDHRASPADPSVEPNKTGLPAADVNASAAALLAEVSPNQLSHLHPTSLVFDLLSHSKNYLVPAAFGLIGAAQGDLTLLVISALVFIPAVLVSVVRYFTLKYCISGGNLIVAQGLLFRKVRTVPVSRIQNIDFVQNVLHRLLHVAEVKVETASGTKPEAILRVLSMTQMEDLREAVFGSAASSDDWDPDPIATMPTANFEDPRLAVPDGVPESDSQSGLGWAVAGEAAVAAQATSRLQSARGTWAPGQQQSRTLLRIPLSWLFKAGLASNRGLIMVGVALGAYFQFVSRQPQLDLSWIRSHVAPDASPWVLTLLVLCGILVAMIAVRLLGIGWYVLRFYGYELTQRGDDLRISCGLFTRVSATVPRQRIQFISIHRSWIMRWLGLASIRIETAGGAGQNSENATETVSKRWFVPVLPEPQVAQIMNVLRPETSWEESRLEFQPLSDRTFQRLRRLAVVQSLMLTGAVGYLWWPWGLASGLCWLPALLWWSRKKSLAMRYARTENGVAYRSGVFNRKTSLTFFEKIQTLQVDQSPFDRRWGMARLSVDTAASGPAEHRIAVPYLDVDFANRELQILRAKTGQEQPVFG